jgi:hypothetical protein
MDSSCILGIQEEPCAFYSGTAKIKRNGQVILLFCTCTPTTPYNLFTGTLQWLALCLFQHSLWMGSGSKLWHGTSYSDSSSLQVLEEIKTLRRETHAKPREFIDLYQTKEESISFSSKLVHCCVISCSVGTCKCKILYVNSLKRHGQWMSRHSMENKPNSRFRFEGAKLQWCCHYKDGRSSKGARLVLQTRNHQEVSWVEQKMKQKSIKKELACRKVHEG